MAVSSIVNLAGMSHDARWDAEHYRPEFLRQEKAMAARDTTPLGKLARVSDGNHLSIAEEFSDEGVRYLRGQDLSDFFISDGDPIFIPEKFYDELERSHMFPGDVLVGVVGTIGSVGLVTARHGKLTGSCKLAIVRPNQLPGEYIAAYLASRIGQNEIQRQIRGAVQMGLILPDLREIPIVIPSDKELIAIVRDVRDALEARQTATEKIAEAESLFTETLSLQKLNLSPSLAYSRPLSDLFAARRFGAEYFMPSKKRAIDALRSIPNKPLSEYVKNVREMWVPSDHPASTQVRNYDVGDAAQMFLDDTQPISEAGEIGSAKKILQRGDVVISRLRSYLRQIAVVRSAGTVPCVGSSEFIVLRPITNDFTAESLMVFLRSEIVQAILRWSQDGTNHPRFDERELLDIPVPDKLPSVRREMDKLVGEAISSRQSMFDSLAKSRSAVETAVLGG